MELTKIFGQEVADEIEKRLAVLSPRERGVFLARRGFDRIGDPPSYENIGRYRLKDGSALTRERIRQIYVKATRKLLSSSSGNLVLQVPLFSCECGKYGGLRYLGIICDKCGGELMRKGELQTLLVTETWEDGKKVLLGETTAKWHLELDRIHRLGTEY